jgi:hypothetical protein
MRRKTRPLAMAVLGPIASFWSLAGDFRSSAGTDIVTACRHVSKVPFSAVERICKLRVTLRCTLQLRALNRHIQRSG